MHGDTYNKASWCSPAIYRGTAAVNRVRLMRRVTIIKIVFINITYGRCPYFCQSTNGRQD